MKIFLIALFLMIFTLACEKPEPLYIEPLQITTGYNGIELSGTLNREPDYKYWKLGFSVFEEGSTVIEETLSKSLNQIRYSEESLKLFKYRNGIFNVKAFVIQCKSNGDTTSFHKDILYGKILTILICK